VECYPNLGVWCLAAEMTELRAEAGVAVLNNVIMYVVGGFNSTITHNSVETYRSSSLQWTSVTSMNYPRKIAGTYYTCL